MLNHDDDAYPNAAWRYQRSSRMLLERAVDTNFHEIKRRLKVWADIEEVLALAVDMAMYKDPKLRIMVVMEESKTAPGTSHQVARPPEEPNISRMMDELRAYFEIKHGTQFGAGR